MNPTHPADAGDSQPMIVRGKQLHMCDARGVMRPVWECKQCGELFFAYVPPAEDRKSESSG